MTRSIASLPVSFSLWLAVAGIAYGQASVEAGLGAARAVTTTAPAKGLGKSMSGLAGSLDRALKAGPPKAESTASSSPSANAPAASTAPAPVASWEDPGGIEPGLSYEDLVRRFGPSAMSITSGAEKSLTYPGKDGMFQVKVQDGKVASIARPKS
jgi:hypothetical protein